MLRIGKEIRFRLAGILLLHWKVFVANHRKWIRPVGFETVRKIIGCRTPALGCNVYPCPNCHKIEVVFGLHAMVARYFDRAQRATAPFHPALQAVPG